MALTDGSPLIVPRVPQAKTGLLEALNSTWHKLALQAFMIVVLAHWAEHLAQAVEVYVLGWGRPHAGGALGHLFPWLVQSEWLHYGYAIVMLAGLVLLRPGFVGLDLTWWTAALAIQVWHHFEHLLLLGQALTQRNLFGAPVPTSILQLVLPRMELHLFYNAIVFIPMVIAVYFHHYPRPSVEQEAKCSCRRRFVQAEAPLAVAMAPGFAPGSSSAGCGRSSDSRTFLINASASRETTARKEQGQT